MALAAQTPDEVQEALAAIFARPEFAPPPRSPLRELLSRAFGAIADFLRSLLPHLELGTGARTLVFWIVVGGIVLAAAYLVLRLRRGRGRRPGRLLGRASPAGSAAAGEESAEGWERRAATLAAEGRLREATLALYQALLHHLARRGALRIDPAKTPGDYRRESRGDRESLNRLDRFLRSFEPVAFGGIDPDPTTYATLRELASGGSGRG